MKTLAQVEPRTAISSLPFVIKTPGSYYVTTNLSVANNSIGITISNGNVNLDLNGYTLDGANVGSVGIYFWGSYTNVVVKNGVVANWGNRGIDSYSAGSSRQVLLEGLKVFNNGSYGIFMEADTIIRNCTAMLNFGDGIFCAGGEIMDCTSRSNFNYGLNVYHCTVRNCRADYNLAGGLAITDSRVLDCAVDNNFSTAISTVSGTQNEIRRCHICGNGSNGGIVLQGKGPGYISDCLIANNQEVGIFVTGDGFVITGNDCYSNSTGGISVSGSNCRVDGNHVVTPYTISGIRITPGSFYSNNVVVRNTVAGGGSSAINYDRPASGHDIGPIGTAATSTSPWANISH